MCENLAAGFGDEHLNLPLGGGQAVACADSPAVPRVHGDFWRSHVNHRLDRKSTGPAQEPCRYAEARCSRPTAPRERRGRYRVRRFPARRKSLPAQRKAVRPRRCRRETPTGELPQVRPARSPRPLPSGGAFHREPRRCRTCARRRKKNPSSSVERSTFTMLPAQRSSPALGMPWQTTSSAEMQQLFEEALVVQRRRCTAEPARFFLYPAVDFRRGNAGRNVRRNIIENSRVDGGTFRMPSICAGVLMHACGGIGKPCRCRASRRSSKPRWHRLYFLPLPHQQGALRSGIFKKSPSFGSRGGIVAYSCSACARRRAGMRGQRIRVRRSHTARRYRECAGWSFAKASAALASRLDVR